MTCAAPIVKGRKENNATSGGVGRNKPQLRDPEAWRQRNRHKNRKPKTSAKTFMMGALKLALESGPATSRECANRMGLSYGSSDGYHSGVTGLLRILEQRGEVSRITELRTANSRPVILWALVMEPGQ